MVLLKVSKSRQISWYKTDALSRSVEHNTFVETMDTISAKMSQKGSLWSDITAAISNDLWPYS